MEANRPVFAAQFRMIYIGIPKHIGFGTGPSFRRWLLPEYHECNRGPALRRR